MNFKQTNKKNIWKKFPKIFQRFIFAQNHEMVGNSQIWCLKQNHEIAGIPKYGDPLYDAMQIFPP